MRELSKKEMGVVYFVYFIANIIFFCTLIFSDMNEENKCLKEELEKYKSRYSEEVEVKELIEKDYFNLFGEYLSLSNKYENELNEIEELEKQVDCNSMIIKDYNLSLEDVYLITEICEYEAGVNNKEGQKAVTKVILNRLSSSRFPNSIRDIIYQENQFTTSKYVRGKVDKEVLENVYETIIGGYDLPEDVLFFRSGKECVKENDYKVIDGNIFSF